MVTEETSVEVKIWIRGDGVRKVFIKGALKALPLIFGLMVAYFLYSFGFVSIGFFRGNAAGIVFIIFMILVMAGFIAVLYAVGSGFQEVAELEKPARKRELYFANRK